jgi:hypothetical protein
VNKAILLAFLTGGLLTGCVASVGPAYEVEPVGVDVYVPAPDIFIFGGFDRDHRDRDAGRRGGESRRSAGHSAPARSGHERR